MISTLRSGATGRASMLFLLFVVADAARAGGVSTAFTSSTRGPKC